MDLDDRLSGAFASWSAARDELSRLRGKLPPSRGGQFAQSPELGAQYAGILAQEQACEQRFAELLAVADQRARSLEHRDTGPPRGPAAPEPGTGS
jgi:hypothetical protein